MCLFSWISHWPCCSSRTLRPRHLVINDSTLRTSSAALLQSTRVYQMTPSLIHEWQRLLWLNNGGADIDPYCEFGLHYVTRGRLQRRNMEFCKFMHLCKWWTVMINYLSRKSEWQKCIFLHNVLICKYVWYEKLSVIKIFEHYWNVFFDPQRASYYSKANSKNEKVDC